MRCRDLLDSTHDTIVHLERSASQLSLSGGAARRWRRCAPGVLNLRGVQKRLVELLKDGTREGEQLNLVAQVVRDDLRDLRMVPASQVLEPLRRTVREVSSRLGKQVELFIAGGDVRLDRRILDALKDPLLHLVRNAIDHGIEIAGGARARRARPRRAGCGCAWSRAARASPWSWRMTAAACPRRGCGPRPSSAGCSPRRRRPSSPTRRRRGSSSSPASPPAIR